MPYPAEDVAKVEGLDRPVPLIPPAGYYSHHDGLAIGSGYVYRGTLLPQLTGKYVFTEITTGRLFYADLAALIANQGKRVQSVPINEIEIAWRSPGAADAAPAVRRMYDIAAEGFKRRGGVPLKETVLPGASSITGGFRNNNLTTGKVDPYGVPYGGGRADVRLARDGDGELYLISKSDGMIRKITAVLTPPPR